MSGSPEFKDGINNGPVRGRGAGVNPGNRFESLRLHVLGDHLDQVTADHPNGVQVSTRIGQDDSLPRRITITYEHEEGRPQFRARLTDWDLSPRLKDSTFEFDPPKGAEKIAFARRPMAGAKEGSK